MFKAKIARQDYRRARHADLFAYAENVYKSMKDAPIFLSLQIQLAALTILIQNYSAALAAARNRGASQIVAKKRTRIELIAGLDSTATDVETLANGDEEVIVNSGYTVQQDSSVRYKGILPPPAILRAQSTGQKGELRITLNNFFPKAVRSHFIQCSLDQTASWSGSWHHSGSTFKLRGLPRAADMLIRIKSIGNGSNESDWSEPVRVAVL